MKFVGIYSRNSLQWKLIDIANLLYGLTCVPVYHSLGVQATKYMFNQTELSTIFLTCDKLAEIAEFSKNGELPFLKNIVIMDEWNLNQESRDSVEGLTLLTLNDVIEAGKSQTHEYVSSKPDDIIFLAYTSGTTGNPKGAMASNRNVIAGLSGTEDTIPIGDCPTHLSYLPLVHLFERCIITDVIYKKGRIGFYSGDPKLISHDIAALKPRLFISVPRLYNRFYGLIKNKIDGLPKEIKEQVENAIEEKRKIFRAEGKVHHEEYDSGILAKFKAFMGGECVLMVTGSAPISNEVREFLALIFCCPFIEGYGQTECVGAEFIALSHDNILGHVGGVNPQIEMKVIDVPEMNYFSTYKDKEGRLAPKGELLVRSASVIQGYYKSDEKTKEAIDEDGWLHSGDIVTVLPESGAIKIIDRRKNIFKLSIGEYVAPDKLEQLYKLIPEVTDILIYGNSFKNHIIAVVFSEEAELRKVAGVEGEFSDLVKSEQVRKEFLKLMQEFAKKENMLSFEKVKNIYLSGTSFEELGLLTGTFKLKRHQAHKHFKTQLDELYEEGVLN